MMNKKILITGMAGFIGFHTAKLLSSKGYEVHGFDNYNDYYEISLKKARATELGKLGIDVIDCDLRNFSNVKNVVEVLKPDLVIHLAAYAGVRHSLNHPRDYIDNNIIGTQNLIEACEQHGVKNVIYASTSCVMAGNDLPWKEDEPTWHQMNPYGFTKRTNESQFKTSKIERNIGLRFFTVYGPWGRPDMALFTFSRSILKGETIGLFNYGDMKRDFTFIDDIVQGINIIVERILFVDTSLSEIYNIGYGQQVDLMTFVNEIENNFNKKAIIEYLPKHPADSQETWSDTTKLQALGYKPTTSIKDGVKLFADWYKEFYGVE
jgi:UDP-glucuronate 4-epimerase